MKTAAKVGENNWEIITNEDSIPLNPSLHELAHGYQAPTIGF